MPAEPPNLSQAARTYLGSITGNAWRDFTGQGRGSATRALWQAIRSAAQNTGAALPSFREVNAARAWAGSQVAAARTFRRADSSETDFSGMTATVANSRPLSQRDAEPRYTVRYQLSYMEGDQQTTSWFTHSIGRNLPSSVGDLRDQLDDLAASGLGDSPPAEGEFTGTAFIAAM